MSKVLETEMRNALDASQREQSLELEEQVNSCRSAAAQVCVRVRCNSATASVVVEMCFKRGFAAYYDFVSFHVMTQELESTLQKEQASALQQRDDAIATCKQQLRDERQSAIEASQERAQAQLEQEIEALRTASQLSLDKDRVKWRAQHERALADALALSRAECEERTSAALTALNDELASEANETLSATRREAEAELKLALQAKRRAERLRLNAKVHRLRSMLAEAEADLQSSVLQHFSDGTPGSSEPSQRTRTQAPPVRGEAVEQELLRLREEVEELREESERAVDAQASLAQEVVRLRVKLKQMQSNDNAEGGR